MQQFLHNDIAGQGTELKNKKITLEKKQVI